MIQLARIIRNPQLTIREVWLGSSDRERAVDFISFIARRPHGSIAGTNPEAFELIGDADAPGFETSGHGVRVTQPCENWLDRNSRNAHKRASCHRCWRNSALRLSDAASCIVVAVAAFAVALAVSRIDSAPLLLGPPAETRASVSAPSVVLVVLDAVRADHLMTHARPALHVRLC